MQRSEGPGQEKRLSHEAGPLVSYPPERLNLARCPEHAKLTTIEDDLFDTGLLAQVIEDFACRIEAVSWQVHGPLDGTSSAVGATRIHEEEVARLLSHSTFSFPKQLKDKLALHMSCC